MEVGVAEANAPTGERYKYESRLQRNESFFAPDKREISIDSNGT